jgi:hypothetical protein
VGGERRKERHCHSPDPTASLSFKSMHARPIELLFQNRIYITTKVGISLNSTSVLKALCFGLHLLKFMMFGGLLSFYNKDASCHMEDTCYIILGTHYVVGTNASCPSRIVTMMRTYPDSPFHPYRSI